jgi:acetoin utilization deacetylase AcuC-like enzyme
MNSNKTPCIWYDMLHVFHAGEDMHPEHPERVNAVVAHLRKLYGSTLQWNVLHEEFNITTCRRIGQDETNLQNNELSEKLEWQLTHDGDTYITKYTDTLCRRGQWILSTVIENIVYGGLRSAFVLIRPPGHHASTKSGPRGFCHLNNVWVAVEEFNRRRVRHIGILDWDVHHGDGTEICVRDNKHRIPGIRFVSMHAYGNGIYPGTGANSEDEHVLNIGLPRNTSANTYIHLFKTKALPYIGKPDVLIVSAGYDAHYRDPMLLMKLRSTTYRQMSEAIREIGCPVLFVLEGGYAPDVLAKCVGETLAPWIQHI